MKKCVFALALLLSGVGTFTSCGSDEPKKVVAQDPSNLDYNSSNAGNWNSYAHLVARLLVNDSKTLLRAWTEQYESDYDAEGNPLSYARLFQGETPYTKGEDGTLTARTPYFKTQLDAIEQLVDGCVEISGEVGEKKIGDPLEKYNKGKVTEALYAVESWYSWHSREDYQNNIFSIRNALLCSRDGKFDHTENGVSILNYVAAKGNHQLTQKVYKAVNAAADAIKAIPQPFRNNINSKEALAAQEACGALSEVLEKELKPWLRENADEAAYKQIIKKYVDVVVLPTYKDLVTKNEALLKSVEALRAKPSNEAFKNAANAWLEAREPWETSEAFLFGPVSKFNLDPNMDSWPLDQVQIVNVLTTGDYSQLTWNPGQSEEAIQTAQNTRGYHTLEYLLFKDGKPRTVK